MWRADQVIRCLYLDSAGTGFDGAVEARNGIGEAVRVARRENELPGSCCYFVRRDVRT